LKRNGKGKWKRRTTKMKNLKPCPFCGGEVNITYYSADNVFVIWHKDDKCKFIEPMYIDCKYAKSLSDARNIWNKRDNVLLKEQEAKPQRYDEHDIFHLPMCPNKKCHAVMTEFWHYCPYCGARFEWDEKLDEQINKGR
jgi:endogenous inhibitor of DNA gyrase (YacG/DUF329 family)